MNICVNYWGQPRLLNVIEHIYNSQINDGLNNFHICYTTWKDENVSKFKELFKDSYINQIDKPNLELEKYKDIINKFTYHSYNPDIKHYMLGIYIREQSLKTVVEYQMQKNINFDFIITIRPDTIISEGVLYSYYSTIIKNMDYIYVCDRPRYDIYNKGAIPDAVFISSLDTITKIIKSFSFEKDNDIPPDFDNVCVNGNIIHPETVSGQLIRLSDIPIYFLNLHAFRSEHYGKHENL